MAASFTANQKPLTLSRPKPPEISTLTKPMIEMKFQRRRAAKS